MHALAYLCPIHELKRFQMKTVCIFAIVLFAGLVCPLNSRAQDSIPVSPTIFSRLQQYDPLNIIIQTDVKKLKSGGDKKEWQPAVFKIMAADTVVFEQNIQVAARGNMRKKTCDFPPVKIKFFEGDMENDSLEDINELKLVVSCRNSAGDEQLVLREYIVYKLYNQLTEESFRVKKANVKFDDPNRKRGGMETLAFFIESEVELAVRLGGRPIKPRIISPKGMDTTAYDRMCLFEFMIGNTDFGAYTRHNVKVIGFKGRPPVAIPYDFDYAGFVDADYALPSPDVPIQDVRQRYYLGLCRDAASYNNLFKEFIAQREALEAIYNQDSDLDKDSRRHSANYLKEFFDILDDPRKAQKMILENCNKRIVKNPLD